MDIDFCKEDGTLFSGKRNGVASRERFLKINSYGFYDGIIVVNDRVGQLITSSFVFGLVRDLVCEWVSAGVVKTELDVMNKFDISGMQEINKSEFQRGLKRICFEIMD